MKKLTQQQWEGVKVKFKQSYVARSRLSGGVIGEILSFFEKEVVEDTETTGGEKKCDCDNTSSKQKVIVDNPNTNIK